MKIRAVVFDLDGVMFDACDLHYEALNMGLKECGYDPISREDHEGKFDGLSTRLKCKMLGMDTEETERVNDAKQRQTVIRLSQVVKTDMRLVAVLQQLRDRGYKLACASNSVRASVDHMVNGTGAAPFMEFTLSNEDVENPKPHPEIYSLACTKLGFKPHEVLVVEDNVRGQRACLEAGCRLCVVKNPTEVTLHRILEGVSEHEALGYRVPAPEPRNRPLDAGATPS